MLRRTRKRAARAALTAAIGFAATATRDRRTRAATRRASRVGRQVLKDISGMRRGQAIARIARDPRLQAELAALARAGAAAYDASRRANRRRRRLPLLLVAGGIIAGAITAALRKRPWDEPRNATAPGMVPGGQPPWESVGAER